MRPGTVRNPTTVFDRLTDHRAYTGHHAHRFDAASGRGLALAGRDRIPVGVLDRSMPPGRSPPATPSPQRQMLSFDLRDTRHDTTTSAPEALATRAAAAPRAGSGH